MNKWDIVHSYNNLVKDGLLDELTCPLCGVRLVSRLGPGDDPMFRCVGGHTVFPGKTWYLALTEKIRGFKQ